MTQPQACTGTIRLLPAPRPPFSQIDCFGRAASQVLGSLFLRRGTPCPSEQRMGPNARLGCGAPASPCLAQGVLPLPSIPHLAYLDNLAQHADGLDQFGLAGVAVDRSSRASIAAGLVGCTPPSQLRSTSTATERCSRLTDRTSFIPDLILTMIPVIPRRGPSSIRATWPTCRYGQGIVERPLFPTRWIAAISSSATGIGVLPIPTI